MSKQVSTRDLMKNKVLLFEISKPDIIRKYILFVRL